MEPQFGIIGDNTGVELPQAELSEDLLEGERKIAKYAKSKEFKALQQYFEERIAFYQKYLPDGRNPVELSTSELGEKWVIANTIINEFRSVIDMHERAKEVVDKANREKNGQ